ncbi:hypothetical protein AGDE_02830 [Angomonas deanei]|nr:hypothetical protein AGDE_12368 [Angomonas deanei]EPY41095.1 hypothetical protein AGDE_02830 [Angomonas deanei]|eukprot:EPY24396.1 hypothetical protein AGDE_12368 [Angomonas deanei]
MYPIKKKKSCKSLNEFVESYDLKETAPLSNLRALRSDGKQIVLSVDGNKLLEDVKTAVQHNDKMAIFTLSTPLDLYSTFETTRAMLANLCDYFTSKKMTCKPLIVFDGCGVVSFQDELTSPPLQTSPEFGMISVNSPAPYENPEFINKCGERFSVEEDVEGFFVRLFACYDAQSFVAMRAPHLAWSQISAFFSKSSGEVSEVFGCLELLAFPGIERVIVNIDTERNEFTYVSKDKLFAAMRKLNPDLKDDCISAIILFLSTHKAFKILRPMSVEELCGEMKPFADPRDYVNSIPDEKKRKYFLRNLAPLDAPVLSQDTKVVPLGFLYGRSENRVNVSDFFGRPLPLVLYYLMMAGPLLTAPFSTISQDLLVDDWPLVDSSHYRLVSERVLPLRVQIVHQLFQFLKNRADFKFQGLRWLRQYLLKRNVSVEDERHCKIADPPEIDLAFWEARWPPAPDLVTETYFSDVLRFTEYATNRPFKCADVKSTLSVVLLRALDLLGYFSHSVEATHGQTVSGYSVFSRALKHFEACPTLSEYGVLLIELYRTRALTELPITMAVSHQPGSAKYSSHVLFASRAVSIVPINVIGGSWNGPFDPDMAAFGTCTRLVGRTLRTLTEVLATILFLDHKTAVPLSEFSSVVKLLPFTYPVEFSSGFLMLYVLSNPNCTIASLQQTFPELSSLADDLYTLFFFWSLSFSALRTVYREDVDAQVDYTEPKRFLDMVNDIMAQSFGNLYPGQDNIMTTARMTQDAFDYQFYASQPPPQMPHHHQHQQQGYYR